MADNSEYKKADNKHNCAGFVILCSDHTLLVCSRKGNWGFPKGKINKDELDSNCAAREVCKQYYNRFTYVPGPVSSRTLSIIVI